jgi:YD repeat-containing protein
MSLRRPLRMPLLTVLVVGASLLGGRVSHRSAVEAQTPPPITYVYDELSRLIAVVDPSQTQGTAIYSYDAAGNILSIARQSATLLAILQVTPSTAPVGTTVTIWGSGFSTAPSQNTVSFNGTAATVTSATTTQLVTTVPAGATSGSITVTTGAGSANSPTPFTVSAITTPTITGISPTIGPAGTALTITGTSFDTTTGNNKVRINGTLGLISSVTGTSIATTVPIATGSGRVTVSTPSGAATSSQDFFVPPAPYTAADVVASGRATTGGASTTVTIPTANKVALVLFDGTIGQRLDLGMTGVTIGTNSCCSTKVSIYDPVGGTFVAPTFVGTSSGDIDTAPLPMSGTYTILIDPEGTNSGSITLTLSEPVTGTLTTTGTPTAVSLSRPGQDGRFTFSGTAGQRVSVGVSGASLSSGTCCIDLAILKPDGSVLDNIGVNTTYGGDDLDTAPLPVTGTYTGCSTPRTPRRRPSHLPSLPMSPARSAPPVPRCRYPSAGRDKTRA